MTYEHLKPIEGVASDDPTAVTFKRVQDLIAEEKAERAVQAAMAEHAAEAAKSRAAALKARARPEDTAEPSHAPCHQGAEQPVARKAPALQTPPRMPDVVARPASAKETPAPKAAKPTKSFFERVFGK